MKKFQCFKKRIMMKEQTPYLTIDSINTAKKKISTAMKITPLQESFRLSKVFDANISLKREDLQPVRSYKLRGAYHKIKSLFRTRENQWRSSLRKCRKSRSRCSICL